MSLICSGILCGQPSLRPLMYYSCPNKRVTYTCHDSQVKVIQWTVEPYIPKGDPIIFSAHQSDVTEGSVPVNRTPAVATLTSVINRREESGSADMTTTLTINSSEVENKTSITCTTQRGIEFSSSSTYLYIAGWSILY